MTFRDPWASITAAQISPSYMDAREVYGTSQAKKILDFKLAFVGTLDSLMEKIATKIFNYPQNLGMPITPNYSEKDLSVLDYISK